MNEQTTDETSAEVRRRRTSRRRFLALAGGGVAVLALVGAGGLAIGLHEPTPEHPSAEYGKGDRMAGKILVTYATKCGSTGEVAAEVAKVLAAAGRAVELRPLSAVKDLSLYESVVLGSAVRMGALLSEAQDFVRKNGASLAKMPTAYFALCTTMKKDTPANRETAAGFFKPLRAVKEPVSVAAFAGKLDYSRIGPVWRFIASRDKSGDMEEGDFRDWAAIRAWVQALPPLLAGG